MGRNGDGVNECQCAIPGGGYCERHKVRKPQHFVNLCRTNLAYFQAWEEGRGPGQSKREPSFLTEAWNVASAVLAFVGNPGWVDAQTYHTRLGICNACDKRSGHRCSVCGCFVAMKAKGKAWECPEKKWLAIVKPKRCGGCGR
jgi:hypothetical protein